MASQETTYACGHIWHTGFNGTSEEQERLRRLVNEKWAKGPCAYCQHFKQEEDIEELAWNDCQHEECKPAEDEPCTGCENGCDQCLEGKEPVYDDEPDEYIFREDHPNLPRWPATGRDKDRHFGNAINPIQLNWW